MAYKKTVWENAPSTATPINATNLNNIETGIENNDLAINEIGKFTTLSVGSNGDYYTTLKGTLSAGDIINVYFPLATNNASNARISINGSSGTYINIFDGSQLLANQIEGKYKILYYDGTQFQLYNSKNIISAKRITTNQSIANSTVTLVQLNSENAKVGGKLSFSSNKIVVGPGVKKVMCSAQLGLYQITVGSYIFLRLEKNYGGSAVEICRNDVLAAATQESLSLPSVLVDVVEGDTISILTYIEKGTGSAREGRTWLTVEAVG